MDVEETKLRILPGGQIVILPSVPSTGLVASSRIEMVSASKYKLLNLFDRSCLEFNHK